MTRRIFRTSVVSIGLKGCGAVLSVLVTALLARLLGAEGFGAYAYVLAIYTLLALPAQAGLPQLVTRETAMAMAQEEPGKVLGLWKWAGTLALALGTLVIICLCIVLLVNEAILGEFKDIYLAGMAIPLLLAAGNIRAGALRGLKKVVYALFSDSVMSPLMFLILIASAFYLNQGLTPDTAILLHTIAMGLAFIFGAVILHRSRPWAKGIGGAATIDDRKSWWVALMPMSMTQGFRLINSKADVLMLGILASMVDVGIFKAMLALSASLLLSIEAINGVIAPHIAESYQKKNQQEIERTVVGAALASFLLMLIPATAFIVWGRDLIRLIYGDGYVYGYTALIIVLVGHLVNASVGPVALLLDMTGYERYTMRGVGGSTFLNILLNILLIPRYGMVGAAISSAITMIGWNLLLLYFVKIKLNINSSIFNSALTARGFWNRVKA